MDFILFLIAVFIMQCIADGLSSWNNDNRIPETDAPVLDYVQEKTENFAHKVTRYFKNFLSTKENSDEYMNQCQRKTYAEKMNQNEYVQKRRDLAEQNLKIAEEQMDDAENTTPKDASHEENNDALKQQTFAPHHIRHIDYEHSHRYPQNVNGDSEDNLANKKMIKTLEHALNFAYAETKKNNVRYPQKH
ncbi:uncharacterized protein MONOS_11494 [Monocercomonoides exilis]|uniref:uncharacterized protein n=1 Tax=Monocercomonoides exilis TaxID=2049356 RepID=UPI00355A933D|nr:hypothetical protein MONOS_11494 [Monocercomonoides exilis]|eukprot:MONOS_11494.1-p1 / transcript=MONOS_11494.1 / gene=MONOS_11494 / organism=Monocercomonoides_exilis_PA203 / gene_product=unspecified product / transcript_product=unspecified product / location=Mono_scaffold00580:13205-13845(-) / protein_length=190 / sequence_SO=supercontig / SO=protein_coding / is_pseudo=false